MTSPDAATSDIMPSMISALLLACSGGSAPPVPSELIAVAVESDGEVAFLAEDTAEPVFTVDVPGYLVHNVQGAPDGASVWATAVANGGHGHGKSEATDHLVQIAIDAQAVTQMIELGEGVHPAHVVLHDETAYVALYEADAIAVIDTISGTITNTFELPPGTAPHGLRLLPDGTALVVAGMGSAALLRVDTASGGIDSFALPGRAVQTATDGLAAFVTIYDTKQVARLDLEDDTVELWDLPPGSAGPIQAYPDGHSLWVADQGLVDEGDPGGDTLVQFDVETGEVLQEVQVGGAPHGVVIDPHRGHVWATIIDLGEVVKIDADTGEVLARTSVGNAPNGITCIHTDGAMP
jgi:DNA-binding beta-propeller fold protein YncE